MTTRNRFLGHFCTRKTFDQICSQVSTHKVCENRSKSGRFLENVFGLALRVSGRHSNEKYVTWRNFFRSFEWCKWICRTNETNAVLAKNVVFERSERIQIRREFCWESAGEVQGRDCAQPNEVEIACCLAFWSFFFRGVAGISTFEGSRMGTYGGVGGELLSAGGLGRKGHTGHRGKDMGAWS